MHINDDNITVVTDDTHGSRLSLRNMCEAFEHEFHEQLCTFIEHNYDDNSMMIGYTINIGDMIDCISYIN